MNPAEDNSLHNEPIPFPITGELDLHTFRPDEIGDLLPEYFAECLKKNILTVRVVHGKGSGTLREGVHRLLERLPVVASWQWPAGSGSGGWGATWVWLRRDAA
jgi:DNA-nicking Smr family endonuclease